MSQLLVIIDFFAEQEAEFKYFVVSNRGNLRSRGRSVPALLPKTDTAVLVLPSQAMSWHQVRLPKLSRGISAQKQQTLLTGLLEEQLLDEPAELHLALYQQAKSSVADRSGQTWVAACNKTWLYSIVEALKSAKVPLVSIIPLAFPTSNSQLYVHGVAAAPFITHCDDSGVVSIPLSQIQALPEFANDMETIAEPAVALIAEQVLGYPAKVLKPHHWAFNAVSEAKEQGLDLAQGELAIFGRGRLWQSLMDGLRNLLAASTWRPVRYGLGLLLLANVVGLNAWAWKQSTQIVNQRAQMTQLLTQSFPEVKVVVDAPLQMQRELPILRQTQGQLSGQDFESILSRFSSVAGMNASPNAIEYVANEVQIKGANLSGEQLNELLPRFQYAGLNVRSDARALIVSHSDAVVTAAAGAKR
jgi:general secretion pathway protein L